MALGGAGLWLWCTTASARTARLLLCAHRGGSHPADQYLSGSGVPPVARLIAHLRDNGDEALAHDLRHA